MKDFIWFWKASKEHTGYNWAKLLCLGWKPLFRFMRLTKDNREYIRINSR